MVYRYSLFFYAFTMRVQTFCMFGADPGLSRRVAGGLGGVAG